ncbi:30S ribosomal protein S6 [Microgenomates group bacterium]|nr:30S ribosomal protein S6 [Microgenomates group bacterium]
MAKSLITKIVPERKYEITYLVSSGMTTSELNTVRDEMVSLVGKYKGKVVDTQDWGKKTLAYPIKHGGRTLTEAVYTHLVVALAANKVGELTKEIELKKEVVRSLVVGVGDEK